MDGQRAGGGTVASTPHPSRTTIKIGDPAESRRTGDEVIAPARLLRAWHLLSSVNQELPTAPHDQAADRRASLAFDRVRTEILESVSPPLAEEARSLIPVLGEQPGAADVRIACSGAIGWLDGLVRSMLMQLSCQATRTHAAPLPGGGGRRRGPRG
ncbi:proteasome activator [Actinomadura sp. NTSP31]|uniref:proteasome activator n=1 Tax=Actinomadura sp. NTSP31 TaxID=1735447 RepID=UPI0035BEDCAB